MVVLRRLALVVVAVLMPASAFAVSVYLNGTKVDGLANTTIEKCAVQFDAKGNVQLNCPGYSVKLEGASDARPQADDDAKVLTRKYFLVTEQAQQGASGFDIELYINAKFVRRLKNDEEQIVTEVTKHLVPGANSVTFIARKKTGRPGGEPGQYFRVIIGEGNASGDRVMIDNPVITFQRTAADGQDATQEFTLTTR